MQILKHLLENMHESQVVLSRLESSQTQMAQTKLEIAGTCIEFLKVIIKELLDKVVRVRISDPQEWTRRVVLDGLHNFDYNEFRAALQIDQELLDIVVDALRDQKEVQKSALTLLMDVLNKFQLHESSNTVLKIDMWQRLFQRSKLQLMKLCRM